MSELVPIVKLVLFIKQHSKEGQSLTCGVLESFGPSRSAQTRRMGALGASNRFWKFTGCLRRTVNATGPRWSIEGPASRSILSPGFRLKVAEQPHRTVRNTNSLAWMREKGPWTGRSSAQLMIGGGPPWAWKAKDRKLASKSPNSL